MKKVELLAPAGNFDCLKAAINNGANAVYLGGKNFSARAFANNFDENELIEAIKFAHLRDVKIYVTLNTLLNEYEFNNAIKMVDFYYQNNVDALLIQDLGLYYFIKNKYPNFEIHCSTQMHVHNIEGIKNAKALGFKRVVIARESNLDFIKEACKQDIEIETFVHGAICVSYSGQCLMSSYTKNRSANKGMCAQCCRLRYSLFDENNTKIKTDTEYLLSPKDMFLINDIPNLIEAGVSSFKIEGRMKSSAYVGYVTRMYRQAIDAYYNNQEFSLTNEELNNLKVLFNRDFSNDYLYKKNNLFNQKSPNHLGIEIGEVIKHSNGKTYIKLNDNLNQFDGIRIGEFGCIVNMLYKDELLTNEAKKGDIVSIKTDDKLNGKVYKTLDYKLEKQVNETNELKLPIDINIYIHPDKEVKVTICYRDIKFDYISDFKAPRAQKQPLDYNSVSKQFYKLNNTEYYLNNISVDTNNAFLSVGQLNELRRNVISAFNEYRLSLFKRNVINANITYKDIVEDELITNYQIDDDYIDINNKRMYINYVINVESKYSKENCAFISEIGGLLKDYDQKGAYYTLNCTNSYTYEFLKKLGFKYIMLSSEISEDDENALIKAFKQRNNINIYPLHLNSNERVVMYLKANPFDKYINDSNSCYLSDGIHIFRIKHKHTITELVQTDFDRK